MARVFSFLALAAALVCLTVPAGAADKPGDGTGAAGKLDGAWRMVGSRNADTEEYAKLPEGLQHIKLVVGGRFVWTTVQDGKIIRSAGGKCAVKGDKYIESVEFGSGDDAPPLAGKEFTFSWKLEGGKWYHKGTLKIDQAEIPIDEVWERVKQ